MVFKKKFNFFLAPTKTLLSFTWPKTKRLNKDIWANLSPSTVKLSEINETIRNECNQIIDYTKKIIASHYHVKTTLNSLLRTKYGYSVRLRCSNHHVCKTNWNLRLNLVDNRVILSRSNLCDHDHIY